MVERNGNLLLIDHEESFKTKKKTFKTNKINYNEKNKHWTNEITGNSVVVDVSDPFRSK